MSKRTGQRVLRLRNGSLDELWLPAAESYVVHGTRWGHFDCLFTPAFWASQMWLEGTMPGGYRIGKTLTDEVVACLLGGHGMPAEVGLKAFERLSHSGLLRSNVTQLELESALSEPLHVGNKAIRYRYPRQRAKYIASALRRLKAESPPVQSMEFRQWLLSFEGIGLKTASWITRNVRGCDDVAILDVHILRAGVLMGVFSRIDCVRRDYYRMERKLVDFSKALTVRLSVLDDMIWRYMRCLNQTAMACLEAKSV